MPGMIRLLIALPFQRRGHLVESDRAVAALVQLAENSIGRREIGSTGAKRVLEFRFADLAIAIGIERRKQILESIGPAGWRRSRASGDLAEVREAASSMSRAKARTEPPAPLEVPPP